tara:strand:- start:44 stop:322 length:279 start_codon:yes stop_codon:yes gene_type:complete
VRKLKKLDVENWPNCNCYTCGNSTVHTYEHETEIYPDGKYAVKFYEIPWTTISSDPDSYENTYPDAQTSDGVPVTEGERTEITGREYVINAN